MGKTEVGMSGIECLKIEITREKAPSAFDDYYYHLFAEVAVEGKERRSFHQAFTRESLEDDFESRFNILFELVRRRLLTLVAEERGEKIEEPFYGVTFGAAGKHSHVKYYPPGERRDHRGVLLPDDLEAWGNAARKGKASTDHDAKGSSKDENDR
jgi:hypothetical protein